MPINVDPIPTAALVPDAFEANAIHLERVEIDASNPASPTVRVVVRPYQMDGNGTPIKFAAETWEMTTANVYVAAQRLPKIGAAILAMFDAAKEWHVYEHAREADIDKAAEMVQAVANDAAAAQAVVQEAEAARNTAFAARSGVDDPAWIASDDAWKAAVAALRDVMQAAVVPTQKLEAAQLALADPINPPVTF